MALNVFVDTNILIDFIEQRPYDLDAVNQLFELAENHEVTIFASESVITNALYITSLDQQIYKVLNIISILCINTTTIKNALNSGFKDKEDGILYYGAIEGKVDYFITRNKKDFEKHRVKQLPVVSAKEMVRLVSK